MGEAIGIVTGVVGLIIAFIALKKDHYSKPTEELNHLKLQFQMTKTLSEKVQQQLESYIELNNTGNNLIFHNVTYSKYLSMMKDNYDQSLTIDRYNQLDTLKFTKSNILSLTKSLETQFTALQQVETLMKTL